MPSMDELVQFLAEVTSWTCRPCGQYGTGFGTWAQHRDDSPGCAPPPHDTWGCMVAGCSRCAEAAAAGTLNANAPDPADSMKGGVSDAVEWEAPTAPARWWTAVDANGVELRAERRAYIPGDLWWCGAEASRTRGLAFSATKSGPFLMTVPLTVSVSRGDRISVAGPASAGQVPLTVIPAPRPVCPLDDCGCSGEAHP